MSEQPEQAQNGISLVDSAIADYLEKVDRGEQVDRLAFLNNYPGLAEELSSFFADIDDIDHLVGWQREKDTSSAASEASASIPPDAYGIDTSRIAGHTPSVVTPTEPVRSVPEVIGRYQIVRRLGEGGMGTVYLARDMLLSRSVALKIPHTAALDQPGRRERFLREARAAAHLHHPNICQVFDVGETDGIPYITMAYVEGASLASRLTGWQLLSPQDTVALVSKIAAALEEAHSHGIVHRDLKPANIMINRRNEPVIMDFGLALQLNEVRDARVTKPGTVMGTPAYMSPEQITGDPSAVGAATDIYSLGVILFELLAGRLPFQGSAAEIMVHVLKDDAPLPSSLRPDVDPELDAICQRMLSKQVEDRYPDMAAVITVLKGYRRSSRSAVESGGDSALELPYVLGESGVIPPTVKIDKNARAKGTLAKPRKKKWGLAAASLTSVVLLVAAIAAVTASLARDRNLVRFEVDETVPSDLEVRIDGKHLELSDLNNGIHLEPGSEHNWAIWRGDEAMLWNEDFPVAKEENPAIKVTLRHDPAQEVKPKPPQPATPELVRKLPLADGVSALAMSPDGSILAAAGESIILWDYAKEVEIRRITSADNAPISALTLAFDPSGSRLAVGGESRVRIFDPARGAEDRALDYKGTAVNSLVYSRDGRWLAASSRGGNITIWNVSGQYEPREFTDSRDAESLAFSPDHLILVSAHRDGTVVLRDVNSLQVRKSFATQGRVSHAISFSPDGKFIATGDSLGGVRFWDPETGRELKSLQGHTSDVRALAFTPNGRFLASGSFDRTVRLWDVAAAAELHVIRQEMMIHAVLFDGKAHTLIAGGEGKEVRFWRLPVPMTLPSEAGLLATLEDHRGYVESVDFSPDGRLLVSAGANKPGEKEIDSHVRLWDVATQKLIRRFDSKVRRIKKVRFSSDGRQVAAMSERGEFQFWDATSGARTQDFDGVGFGAIGAGRIRDFDFIPGREQVVVAGTEGHMIVRLSDLKIISSWRDGDFDVHSVAGYTDGRTTWTLSGSAPRVQNAADLIGPRSNFGKVTLWETSLLKASPPLKAPGLQVSLLEVTPDGRYALGGAGGSFALWDLDVRENRLLQNWAAYAPEVGAISQDGNRVLLATQGKRSALVLLDVASGDLVQEFHHPDGRPAAAAAFSPDGQLSASGGEGKVILWRLPPYVDPERRAAEWVLKAGGHITERNTVLRKGMLSDVRDLPEGKVECLTIDLHDNQNLTDDDLKKLAGLRSLGRLDLNGTRITDQGLANLHGLPRLSYLNLDKTQVSDAGITQLAALSILEHLSLQNTRLTGTAFPDLIRCRNLKILVLSGTQVTDEHIPYLYGFPELEDLYLGRTRITDGCVKHLSQMKHLKLFDYQGSKMTEAGVRELKQARPDLLFLPDK